MAKRWEYRITQWMTSGEKCLQVVSDNGGDLDDHDSDYFEGQWGEGELLDHIGSEGWELVSVLDHSSFVEYYFKRKLKGN